MTPKTTSSIETEEFFDLVNEEGKPIGRASRRECHSNPRLLHRVVHIFVFNSQGQIFLQKRSLTKDIQPGKWDTSVGGHVALGENVEDAARREMLEELEIQGVELEFLHRYIWRSKVESELVSTFRCTFDGSIAINRDEISAGGFFSIEELFKMKGQGVLTPNLEHEIERLRLFSNEE